MATTKRTTAAKRAQALDALELLMADHATVEKLFQRFEQTASGSAKRRTLAESIVRELSMHAAIEEQIFYPAVRETIDGADMQEFITQSLDEHLQAKEALEEIEDLPADDEAFATHMTSLIEDMRLHIEQEEEQLFPKVRDAFDQARLREIGEAMAAAKKIAPTRPHPAMPDQPPANVVVGSAVGVVDRVIDMTPRVVRSGVMVAMTLVRVPFQVAGAVVRRFTP